MQRLARRLVLRRLGPLAEGSLCLSDALGEAVLGAGSPRIHLTVHDPVLYVDVLTRGLLGAGEAYGAGAWAADDLPGVIRLFLRNRPLMETLDGGLARVARPLLRLLHAPQRNSRSACRRYIAAHYDLGNDFFALFLDATMTYSAAVFERPDATLEEASLAKYDRIARNLALRPGLRVLEIGCGWGGFAEFAAARYGCHVTGTTISPAQLDYARARILRAGLEGRVELIDRDFRDLSGQYDRVVSIEMIEAIGPENLRHFARACMERLSPEGLLGLQAITIDDRHYDRARKTVDFIKRYIFPGSFIPSLKAIHDAFIEHSDLRLWHLEDIGLDYARTLAHWRRRFLENAEAVRNQGFDEGFIRLWDYYFAYCEGGFRERFLGDVQMVLGRPAAREAPWRGRTPVIPPVDDRAPDRVTAIPGPVHGPCLPDGARTNLLP
ncbi:MAG: class I SAM-dependent methyltransferase [Planctomycetota bacterium]|jgi:cyclopropane-fatty-acyl-phospholipid synthase